MSYVIKIMNGKDKGVEYKLVSSNVLVGRAKYNDIVLNDMKVSRKHAILNITQEGVTIKKISKSNTIIVNGISASHAILEPESIIKIGTTSLKLIDRSALQKAGNMASYSSYNSKPKSKAMFYIILLVTGTLLYLLLASEDQNTGPTLAEEEIKTREMASIEEKTTDHFRSLQQTGKNTLEYKEAQALFIQGFRDYREQNYVRAIDYFNGALALFPDHILSKRYLVQSKTKLDYLIQSLLSESNDYYNKSQYERAIAGYKQILILTGSKDNPTAKEVKNRLKESQLLLKVKGDF